VCPSLVPLGPSHIKYSPGRNYCKYSNSAVKSVLATVLQPWSSGKDPDRYSGIRGDVTNDVITVANDPVFKSLRNHPSEFQLSWGPWGVKVGIL
jgi:hypothetical protein